MKPSTILRAMILGIKIQEKRKNFTVDMSSWGHSYNKMCFGCAATCVIQKLANKNLTVSTVRGFGNRSTALHWELHDLHRFESSINAARQGRIQYLMDYLGINKKLKDTWLVVYYNDNRNDFFRDINKIIKYLKGINL